MKITNPSKLFSDELSWRLDYYFAFEKLKFHLLSDYIKQFIVLKEELNKKFVRLLVLLAA